MTDNVPQVYAAISDVMAHMAKEGISKDKRNSQQGYNFRGIDDVYSALCSVLSANRLVMLPFVQTVSREERATKSGGALNYTVLTVDFKLVSAKDGSHDTIRMVGEAMDSADKSSNKAQSAALKYAALQVFMIPTEGDNDADATTHDVAPRQRREAPAAGNDAQTAWVRGQIETFNAYNKDEADMCGRHVVHPEYKRLKALVQSSDPKLWNQLDTAEQAALARVDDLPA